ncbi:hypothetical protein PAPHI01_2297 [Pancytospora philotis]|nr:hypothetical protein PAPHI01_2297 [Pancytospora philotis]
MTGFMALLLGCVQCASTSAELESYDDYILKIEKSFVSNSTVPDLARGQVSPAIAAPSADAKHFLGGVEVANQQWEEAVRKYDSAAYRLNSWTNRLIALATQLRPFSVKRKYGYIELGKVCFRDTGRFISQLGPEDYWINSEESQRAFDIEYDRLSRKLWHEFIKKTNYHFRLCYSACYRFLRMYDAAQYGDEYIDRVTDAVDELYEFTRTAQSVEHSERYVARFSEAALGHFSKLLQTLDEVAHGTWLQNPQHTILDVKDPSPNYKGLEYFYLLFKATIEATILVQRELNAFGRYNQFLEEEYKNALGQAREANRRDRRIAVDPLRIASRIMTRELPQIKREAVHAYNTFLNITHHLPRAPKPIDASPKCAPQQPVYTNSHFGGYPTPNDLYVAAYAAGYNAGYARGCDAGRSMVYPAIYGSGYTDSSTATAAHSNTHRLSDLQQRRYNAVSYPSRPYQ